MRFIALGLHVNQIDDDAIVGHKGRREGQQGIAHPKTLNAGLIKDKQHALVLGHFFAPHQTHLALIKVLCQLHLNQMHAGIEGSFGQLCLGCALRRD